MKRSAESLRGFTLIELMVALMLGAIISVMISSISSNARRAYTETTRKVEVYNSFRLVFETVKKDFSGWIPSQELEFYVDGKGGRPRDFHWQPGEQVADQSDELGPGAVDGGVPGEYDEYGYIEQRQYRSQEWSQVESADPVKYRFHDAYTVYFKTLTFVDGAVREANVEYALVDTSRPESEWTGGVPPAPTVVERDNVKDLSLYKTVRYYVIDADTITATNQYPIRRRVLEVATNVTDFRVEYLPHNPFSRKKSRYVTPEEEFNSPIEPVTKPRRVKGVRGGKGGFRKIFGYGSVKLDEKNHPLATGFYASFGDNQLRSRPDHQPVRFGFLHDPMISFAELTPGDRIFIFTDNSAGGGAQGAAVAAAGGVNISEQLHFPPGDYTVKGNIDGMLEFVEDIDSSAWGERNQRPLNYKAAFLPSSVRVTVRMVDDKGRNPKTMQQVIYLRRKSR